MLFVVVVDTVVVVFIQCSAVEIKLLFLLFWWIVVMGRRAEVLL